MAVPTETYMIHDNGNLPFTVVIQRNENTDSSIVKVYLNPDEDEADQNPVQILEFVAQKVFIGKSPVSSQTLFSGGHGPRFDGNSILLHIEGKKYVSIGESIFSFESFDTIINFISPVGNNNVPYPFCTDSAGRYYFMIEDTVTENMPPNLETPYDDLYSLTQITTDMCRIPPQLPTIPNFQGIHKFYFGGKHYTGHYNPDSSKEYDRLIEDFGSVSVEKTNGIIETLDKEQYVMFMEAFGREAGLRAISEKKMIQARIL
jgi:hypothetical protein